MSACWLSLSCSPCCRPSLVYDEFRFEETSPAIGVPTWWYSIWLPIFSAGITLRVLESLIRLVRRRPEAGQ